MSIYFVKFAPKDHDNFKYIIIDYKRLSESRQILLWIYGSIWPTEK